MEVAEFQVFVVIGVSCVDFSIYKKGQNDHAASLGSDYCHFYDNIVPNHLSAEISRRCFQGFLC